MRASTMRRGVGLIVLAPIAVLLVAGFVGPAGPSAVSPSGSPGGSAVVLAQASAVPTWARPAEPLAGSTGVDPSAAPVAAASVPGASPEAPQGPDLIAGCPPHCNVTVDPSGLPANSTYEVAFSNYLNGSLISESAPSVSFTLTTGTFDLVVLGPSGYVEQNGSSWESFNENSSNVTVHVPFVRGPTADLTFHESGLSAGTDWCWVFAATVRTCSTHPASRLSDITPGMYSLLQVPIPGYNLTSPHQTSIHLTAGANVVHEAFAPVLYSVTFDENGLAPKTHWHTTVSWTTPGPPVRNHHISRSTDLTTMAFSVPNGSFGYLVKPLPGFRMYASCPPHCDLPSFNGSFNVSGSSVIVNLTFVQVRYNVTFTETGLPAGAVWGITLNGTEFGWSNFTITTNLTSLTFGPVPNGSYVYHPEHVAGFATLATGHLRVHGAVGPVMVSYRAVPARLPAFTESALPRRVE